MRYRDFEKLQIGDRIRIKRKLKLYHEYGGYELDDDMAPYVGKIVKIGFVDDDSIKIVGDDVQNYFSYHMLQKIFKFGRRYAT